MKCHKTDCDKDATIGLKLLLFRPDNDSAAEAYLNLAVCDEHKMSEESVRHTLMANWEQICMGFDSVQARRPMLAKTLWKWVPWDEVVDFYKKRGDDPMKVQYKN